MANVSSNMLITDETLSQVSQELLGREDINFTFPVLLIGDGEYPLENGSGPILNHVYEFPVTEVTRTNNNVLLTATIDEEAYLTIKEIGLYCDYGDGSRHLFSKISGLSVAKGRDLAYNLIMQVKLDINVVNTVAMPEIVVREVEYPKLSEFNTVKAVYAYTIENLERMIKTNALGIGSYENSVMTETKPVGVGYNKAQVYHRLQDKLEMWEDNFCATFSYANLKNRFAETKESTTVFHKDLLETFGGAVVEDDGTGTVQSSASGIYVNAEAEALVADLQTVSVDTALEKFISNLGDFFVDELAESMINSQMDRIEPVSFTPIDFNKWNLKVGFTAPINTSNEMTVVNFCNKSQFQPLILGTRNGYCFLELGTASTMKAQLKGNSLLFTNSTTWIPNYVRWDTESPAFTNLHVTKVGDPEVEGSIINAFSENNYLTIPVFLPNTNAWSVDLNVTTGDTLEGTLFNFGKNGYGLRCYLENLHIKVDLSFEGSEVDLSVEGSTELQPDTSYNIKVIFTGEEYSIYVNETLDGTEASTSTVYNAEDGAAALGVAYDGSAASDPFNGSIDLSQANIKIANATTWTGACTSQSVLTASLIPAASSTFYDIEGYALPDLIFEDLFGEEILNQNLFALEAGKEYIVEAAYDGRLYTVSYSNGGEYEEVINLESSSTIGPVAKLIIGSQYNASIGNYLSPYSGILNLDKFDISFYKYNDYGLIERNTHYVFTTTTSYTVGSSLQDYFHIPEHTYSYCKIHNLGFDNSNSILEVLDGYVKGRLDHINFSNAGGFTLGVKAYLKDTRDKIIITKKNDETTYFVLKQENNAIVFEYNLGESTFRLSKTISREEVNEYVDDPIAIYVTCDGVASPTFKMYKNNKFIASAQASQLSDVDISDCYLTNQLSDETETNLEKTVQDIIGLTGVLELNDFYYINNLLDTNF